MISKIEKVVDERKDIGDVKQKDTESEISSKDFWIKSLDDLDSETYSFCTQCVPCGPCTPPGPCVPCKPCKQPCKQPCEPCKQPCNSPCGPPCGPCAV